MRTSSTQRVNISCGGVEYSHHKLTKQQALFNAHSQYLKCMGGPTGEEQLPFALEAQPWSGRKGRTMQRVESEPPTPVCKQVLVRAPQQQPIFQGQLCIPTRPLPRASDLHCCIHVT